MVEELFSVKTRVIVYVYPVRNKVDGRYQPYLSHTLGYGMCMVCVWHVYGMCMVSIWHVYG